MIIGEKNLIIGKNSTIISPESSSTYFHFSKQENFTIKQFKKIIFKIISMNKSPPRVSFI